MKRDHNFFVSRVSLFCSILKKFLKYFLQCIIVDTVYILMLFHTIKFIFLFLFFFSLNMPLCQFNQRVAMSLCLSVCWGHSKTPTSGGHGDLWSKNIFLILACYDTRSCKHEIITDQDPCKSDLKLFPLKSFNSDNFYFYAD